METTASLDEVTSLRAVDRLFVLAHHVRSPTYPDGTYDNNVLHGRLAADRLAACGWMTLDASLLSAAFKAWVVSSDIDWPAILGVWQSAYQRALHSAATVAPALVMIS
jgi:hypothetical protein